MKSRPFFFPLFAVSALLVSPSSARLLITEIQSDGSSDYWELTNTGNLPVSLANFKWNDNAHSITGAVAIPASALIAPGESVIFTGMAAATFRTLWGDCRLGESFHWHRCPGTGSE